MKSESRSTRGGATLTVDPAWLQKERGYEEEANLLKPTILVSYMLFKLQIMHMGETRFPPG
jgi:hypothetical protein